MLSVLAIYGSHRRNQNSDALVDKIIEGLGPDITITRIYAASQGIKSCTACEGCYRLGRCVIKDEMQNIYGEIDKSDVVITATPVYFYTVSSELKKLIDRCQAVWASKYKTGSSIISRKKRLGYVVCTAGEPEGRSSFDCTVKVLELFYKCINTSFLGSLLVSNVDAVHVRDRQDVLAKAHEIGRELRKTYENI